MALVDANYKLIYIDVGSNGRASDGGVYINSSLSQALEEGSLNIPNGRKLLGDTNAEPMTVVADDAFPLRSNIMKPYPGRGLNRERCVFNSFIHSFIHFIYLRRVALRQKPFFKGPSDKNVNYKNTK